MCLLQRRKGSSMVVHKFSETPYSEKERWIWEGGRTRSSNHGGDPRLARGMDQGPSSVCEGPWRAWLNLIIVVSLAHTYARSRVVRCVCSHESAYEPRVGSAKSQQLTHYPRWTQHSHLVRDVGVVIFNTSQSVSLCRRLCVGVIKIALRLEIEADGDEFR